MLAGITRSVTHELSVPEANDVSTRNPSARSELGDSRGARSPRLLRRLRDARIRSKLGLILVVPVIAIVSLAGLRLVDSGQRALDADLVRSLTALSADISALNHQIHHERMSAASYLADEKPAAQATEAFNQQTTATDRAIESYKRSRSALGSVPTAVSDRLDRIDTQLNGLTETRRRVLARENVSVDKVLLLYGVVLDDLVAYREDISPVAGDSQLSNDLRAAAAFSKAKAGAAEEQAVAYEGLLGGRLDSDKFSALLATLTSQQEAFDAFALSATPDLRGLIDSSVTGDAIQLGDQLIAEITRTVGSRSPVTAPQASNAIGAVADLMRYAEEQVDAKLVNDAEAVRASVLRQVVIESIVVFVTLALAVAFALLLARSMAKSLGRLREGALAVAHHELPAAVARLRDVQSLGDNNSPDEIAKQVRDQITLDSRDEIGQVGQAFNVVHREAVRIAAEQAALRTSVSAMFLNLARRSQTLVDRMIGELDQIERGEEDPKRLAQLFQLDHLATRMRRNDENLLVLAGADTSPPRREDALLIDALRAAQSEVELYDRMEFGTVDSDVSIAARAVNDVVRLLAELMDNATRFSPPNTIVVADVRRIGDYVLAQIEDRGLGMSEEQMAMLNHRLASPSTVDVSAFRMMGLAVVARLAARYDIRVELRPNPDGGTVANVALPSTILLLPKIRGREPLIARQRAPLAVEQGPARQIERSQLPEPVPATLADWAPADDAARRARPAVAVGLHVSGTAASSAAAASGVSMPVAGAAGPMAGAPMPVPAAPMPVSSLAAEPFAEHRTPTAHPDDTTELPIFREMEAAWFRSHGPIQTERWSTPATSAPAPAAATDSYAAYAPPAPSPTASAAYSSAYAPTAAYPQTTVPSSTQPSFSTGSNGGGMTSPTDTRRPESTYDWRTPADTGWQAAATASEPELAGVTRSGLPKRRPMGQLVPGGVEQDSTQDRSRRTPEEVRGLLSAYHRGVQRGRANGGADMSRISESDAHKGTNG